MSNTAACGFTPSQMALAGVLYFLCIKVFMTGFQGTFYTTDTLYEGLISATVVYVYTDLMNWAVNYLPLKETPAPPEEEESDTESTNSSDSEWLPDSYDSPVEKDPPPSPVYVPSFNTNE